jgi:hypothetical protein
MFSSIGNPLRQAFLPHVSKGIEHHWSREASKAAAGSGASKPPFALQRIVVRDAALLCAPAHRGARRRIVLRESAAWGGKDQIVGAFSFFSFFLFSLQTFSFLCLLCWAVICLQVK